MSISFANPALAPLAVLVFVPLLVHLFARSRPPRYDFGSLFFLRRVVRQTLRVKKPRDWLLLLLRSLLAVALVALFLRPVSRAPGAGSPFERRNVVVVVDRSASMAALAGGRSRFAAACAEASELLAGLSRHDAANVVWMDASPDAVFPELGPNVPFLLGNLRSASVSFEAADVEQSIRLAVALLRDAQGSREIDVVSDFQASAWRNLVLPDLEGASLVAVPAAAALPVPNVSVSDLSFSPAEPLPGERVSVSCVVRNFGDLPVRPSLFLAAGEARLSRNLHVLPGDRSSVQFDVSFPSSGVFAVSAECSEDDFAPDNSRFAVARVRPHLRAARVGPDSPSAMVWDRALLSFSVFQVERHASLDSLKGDEDAVLVAEWNGSLPERLRLAALNGSSVLVAPAHDVPFSSLFALLPSPPAAAPNLPSPAKLLGSPSLRLRVASPDDPVFSVFSQGAFGDPSRGSFRSALDLSPFADDAVSPLLSYVPNSPALARIGREPLFLWNLDLDPSNSDWTRQSAFIPLFGELLLGPRSRSAAGDHGQPGIPIPLPVPPGTPVAISSLSGADVPGRLLPPSADVHARFLPDAPGIFRWLCPETGNHSLLAVNLSPDESDLRPLPKSDLLDSVAAAAVSGKQARHLRDGIEWWPAILSACLALVALEGLLLWFWEGRRCP